MHLSYQQLATFIKKHGIQTLTVDVFDTILLRKIHPEDCQFLLVAKQWLPLFHRHISPQITAYQLYSWRQYLRHEIIDTKFRYNQDSDANPLEYDLNLRTWFTALVQQFANLHQVKLSHKTIHQLVGQIIKIELDTEKSLLIPNHQLINTLKYLKTTFPHLKIYFLSDMYLTTNQIKELLKHFHINLFADGLTSTDAQHTKASGNIFYYLSETQPFAHHFDLYHNLHLGDNPISDYRAPRRTGSFALRTPITLRRKFNTVKGRLQIHHQKSLALRQDRHLTCHLHRLNSSSAETFWQNYGALFSQPLYTFLFHISNAAQHSPNTTFIMNSSEAATFHNLAEEHFADLLNQPNIIVAAKLNRKTILRALIWAVYQHSAKLNARTISQIATLGEINDNRVEIYRFIFGDHLPVSEIVLTSRTKTEFFTGLLSDLQSLTKAQRLDLEKAYDYVAQFLPRKDNSHDLAIVDVGWGGTVPTLFKQSCHLHSRRNHISALYLGVFPSNNFDNFSCRLYGYLMPDVHNGPDRQRWNAVMYEYAYANKSQFPGDTTRLTAINQGLSTGSQLFAAVQNDPKTYYTKVIRPCLQRLIAHPTRREVALISTIKFDTSFITPHYFQIVDTNFSTLNFWLLCFRHPRRVIHDHLYKASHWPAGYLAYYHLPFLRPLIRLYGKLKHRYFI